MSCSVSWALVIIKNTYLELSVLDQNNTTAIILDIIPYLLFQQVAYAIHQ